jgi:hypothetical protein
MNNIVCVCHRMIRDKNRKRQQEARRKKDVQRARSYQQESSGEDFVTPARKKSKRRKRDPSPDDAQNQNTGTRGATPDAPKKRKKLAKSR